MLAPFVALPALVACAATPPDAVEDPPLQSAPDGECDASRVQDYLGKHAAPIMTEPLLEVTGARDLRWIPPNSAITMDYREDRLNVEYDDSFTITRLYCG